MSEHLTWRQLWADTAKVLDDRPAARWLCGPLEPPQTTAGLRRLFLQSRVSEPARGELRLPRGPRS